VETIAEAMLTRRSDPGPDADLLEPTYQASVRRFNERAAQARRLEWIDFHECMSRLHRRLSEEHASKAQALEHPEEEE
jgi:hypothetical protein